MSSSETTPVRSNFLFLSLHLTEIGWELCICVCVGVCVWMGNALVALKVMDPIPLTRKAEFTKVTACHVAVHYYVGFAYLSLGRYADAAATFVSILRYFSRMQQFHTRSYQYGQVRFFLLSPIIGLAVESNALFVTREPNRSARRATECTLSWRSAPPSLLDR